MCWFKKVKAAKGCAARAEIEERQRERRGRWPVAVCPKMEGWVVGGR